MKTEHPISITGKLYEQWHEEWQRIGGSWPLYAATQAARWGADQELEACCDTLQRHAHWDLAVCELMADRRPKPPSLKDELREIIECLVEGDCVNDEDAVTLRRALKALPDV